MRTQGHMSMGGWLPVVLTFIYGMVMLYLNGIRKVDVRVTKANWYGINRFEGDRYAVFVQSLKGSIMTVRCPAESITEGP